MPSIGIMELALILVVVAFFVLGSFTVMRLIRGVPARPKPKKKS